MLMWQRIEISEIVKESLYINCKQNTIIIRNTIEMFLKFKFSLFLFNIRTGISNPFPYKSTVYYLQKQRSLVKFTPPLLWEKAIQTELTAHA